MHFRRGLTVDSPTMRPTAPGGGSLERWTFPLGVIIERDLFIEGQLNGNESAAHADD